MEEKTMPLKEHKRTIRAFMREHYTDARLVELLEHARSGRLAYYSCCCFIGIATANHELAGLTCGYDNVPHYKLAKGFPDAGAAERAYMLLDYPIGRLMSTEDRCRGAVADEKRRRRIIPIIKAEIRRRMRAEALESLENQSPAGEKANLKVEDEVGEVCEK